MIEWKELNREDAATAYDDFCNSGTVNCPAGYLELRKDLVNLFNESLTEIGIEPDEISRKNYSYQVDCVFGLKFFSLLNEKYDMNIRLASNAGVWRSLSLNVIPDIVATRYGINHPDRFWKKAKRLWLRVLWWYIFLSWQGNVEDTLSVIKDNSTDEILQLVDRCGDGGYRTDLYRELMKYHSELNSSERRKSHIFRKVMVLNTARVQVIEPELVSGGVKQYVADLFAYFM